MCVSFSLMYTFEVGRISQWSRGLCNVFTCHTSVARHISFVTVVQSKQLLVWMRLIVCFEMPKISPEILIIYFFCCYFSEQCLVLFINKQVLRMFSFSSTDQILSTLSKLPSPGCYSFSLYAYYAFAVIKPAAVGTACYKYIHEKHILCHNYCENVFLDVIPSLCKSLTNITKIISFSCKSVTWTFILIR